MRAPTEFRFHDHVRRGWPARIRRLGRAVGFDPALPDAVVDTFAAMYFDADPLAEAFVAEAFPDDDFDAGWDLLERAVADGVDAIDGAPSSLRALFADIDADPDWLDRDLVDRGAAVFRRFGTAVFFFAGAITLGGYAENSVAKPLALTGAYAGDTARRRFLETARFWIDVSEPHGLDPGGAGRAAALRVRIMHVFVRARLLSHPEWDVEAWGVPISQADAVLTLMGGSIAPGLGLHALGYLTSRADIEALLHFWRYVGHLMGVRPRWYPDTVEDAARLLFLALVKGVAAAGEDERRLCRSFAAAFADTGWSHRQVQGFVRLFTPPATYRRCELPTGRRGTLQVLAQVPPVLAAETARRLVPPLGRVADRVARRRRAAWLARHLREDARFRAVAHFTR